MIIQRKAHIAGIVSLLILILSAFYLFASPKLFDSDFWWHIATGRYILASGSLPDSDPFSFTSSLEENKNLHPIRENFILKQYWLGQVIFYFVYKHTGATGIILLRALLLTMTLVLVLWRLRRWDVSLPLSFIFSFTLLTIIGRSIGERPVLFTIFFTAVIFFILEDFKDKRDKRIFLLLPLMVLWANLHGGFIIGVVIITVFMLGEGLKIVFKKVAYAKYEIVLFYTATVLALGFSFINPTGWDAFIIAFSGKYKLFVAGIQEYQSPIFYYRTKLSPIDYGYVALSAIFLIVLIFKNRKVDLTHAILVSGLFCASVFAIRFLVFYSIIATMILGKETDTFLRRLLATKISERTNSRLSAVLICACLVSSILFAIGMGVFKDIRFGVAAGYSVPESAVNFIEKNKLQGNVLNDFGYGGYISWRLYPWKKTFIDTRALNLTVMHEYGWIMSAVKSLSNKELASGKVPLWKRLLNHYDINLIFLSIFDIFGQVPSIMFELAEGNEWVPVYCDQISFIFVKNTKQNKEIIAKAKLSKEVMYDTVIMAATRRAIQNKGNFIYLVSIGETFYRMGRLNDALTAYRYAMKRLPSPQIQDRINQIENEIRNIEEKRTKRIKKTG